MKKVTSGSSFHFFGYYDKQVWDRSGRWLLANRVAAKWDFPTALDPCLVGAVDLDTGDYVTAGRTFAWNWQMGCMLQWCEWEPEPTILYNERTTDGFGAAVCSLQGGSLKRLPRPVFGLSPQGSYALSIDFSRLMRVHPTIGYKSAVQPDLDPLPVDDGIWAMSLDGDSDLILSLDDLASFRREASMDRAIHWVTHLVISPSGSRIVFIHRWTERVDDETCWLHRLFTCRPDGSELILLEDGEHEIPHLRDGDSASGKGTYDYEKGKWQISHPLWKNDSEIICWSPHGGDVHYHLYDVVTSAVTVIGEGILTENGHMSYSPCGRWILSDTYPDPVSHERTLFIYDTREGRRHDLGRFYADPKIDKHCRCDLHPRWSRDGAAICIDSVHEGQRQMYLIEVSALTSGTAAP